MILIEAVQSRLRAIEENERINSFEGALEVLRTVGIEDFGYVFMSMPNPQFPKLSRLLPRMATEAIQRSWTGDSGETLLRLTCAFVRSVAYHYTRLTLRNLDGANILDFGCGYGRMARLMYYFSGPSRVVGVDPWDKAIEICREDGLKGNFVQSSYLPTSLPVGSLRFDLIYAFSVFTHLSERATRMCLEVLAKYLQPDGLLVITIRPVEYWNYNGPAQSTGVAEREMAIHREKGFAFLPHNLPAVDGDLTYGDTSLTTEWLTQTFPYYTIRAVDRSLIDPLQYYVFLQHSNERQVAMA